MLNGIRSIQNRRVSGDLTAAVSEKTIDPFIYSNSNRRKVVAIVIVDHYSLLLLVIGQLPVLFLCVCVCVCVSLCQ